ncbi:nucleotidyltransferase family protein [Pseudomonas putida]|uniref:nucleotidyltransferase family protein n=1 Tax=Pseudomonas putida TaxID=303 RepID=UPI003BA051F2
MLISLLPQPACRCAIPVLDSFEAQQDGQSGAYSPLKKVTDGIDRYLIRSTCLGIDTCTGKLYSTHGLNELENNTLRMNELNPRPDLFREKAASYQARWPWLQVIQ